MIIKKIEWISEDAQEATLFIGDGIYECVAFLHPCNLKEGMSLTEPLFALSVKGIMTVDNDTPLSLQRQMDSFVHHIVAKVIDTSNKIVAVGSIEIELDEPLPKDIVAEDIVQFSCNRLDAIF